MKDFATLDAAYSILFRFRATYTSCFSTGAATIRPRRHAAEKIIDAAAARPAGKYFAATEAIARSCIGSAMAWRAPKNAAKKQWPRSTAFRAAAMRWQPNAEPPPSAGETTLRQRAGLRASRRCRHALCTKNRPAPFQRVLYTSRKCLISPAAD